MSLEDIGSIEASLASKPRTWTEATNNSTSVMRHSMTIPVMYTRKPLAMVFACDNRAFLGPSNLMRQHVGFQFFEQSTTVRVWTSALLPAVSFSMIVHVGISLHPKAP